jgi:hypothetical protein
MADCAVDGGGSARMLVFFPPCKDQPAGLLLALRAILVYREMNLRHFVISTSQLQFTKLASCAIGR